MASPDRDERNEPYGLLVDVLEDPERGKERLPRIVGLFESDQRQERLAAALACCAVANDLEDEDTIEYLVRRLSDRLDEEFVTLELTTTLDYISNRYAEQVERVLDQIDEEKKEQGDVPLPEVGNFTRSHYYNQDHSRDDVGRTKIAGVDDTGGRRNRNTHDQREEPEDREEGGRRVDDGDEADEETDDQEENAFGAMGQQRTEVASIATQSRFDKLHILAARQRERYADIYDALVGREGEEVAVALRLLHEPESTADQFDYVRRTETALSRWESVSDHAHVNTVVEWSIEPRPWVATLFAGDALEEYGRVQSVRAVEDAINLADALSYLHRNGVVHAGLDPENVSYPGALLESDDQSAPILDNVGLMNVFRFHFEPALHMDPRYAAPEYFDSRYGDIDHATDIYQLGAVIYFMFTGQPPYTGAFEDVRESVLDDGTPLPSEVSEEVPDAVDDVVSKAMAKQKLTRYETVEHLQQELVGVRGDDQDG